MCPETEPEETDLPDQSSPQIEEENAGAESIDSPKGNAIKLAEISVITARHPERLSKRYDLNTDGTLRKSPGGNLQRGDINIRQVSTLADLADILVTLSPGQALTFGTPKNRAHLLITVCAVYAPLIFRLRGRLAVKQI